MKEVEIEKLIHTRLFRRGNGKDDPIRIIDQWWDMEGKLIFEYDPILHAIVSDVYE